MQVMPRLPRLGAGLRRAALLLALLPAAACSDDDDPDNTPEVVTFRRANLYPEGVEFEPKSGTFLVGSQTAGAIGKVENNGTYTVFADDAALVSSIGLQLDEARNRLLVAVSDPGYNAARTSPATQRKLAQLAIFDRETGQLRAVADLGALRPAQNHFANDVAVDAQGNAYVTDSFAPVIYKVDAQNAASVFLENSQLAAPAGGFGLNGIEAHPDGYLLVARSDIGAIYRVPLGNPAGFVRVSIGQNLTGADGLLLADNKTLLVVCNSQSTVYRLETTDGWTTAAVSGSFGTPAVYPTTLARRRDDAYVLYSHLNELQANRQPPAAEFSINRVKF